MTGIIHFSGVAWDPRTDGQLLVTGPTFAGKTWFRDHTLAPLLADAGYTVYVYDPLYSAARAYPDAKPVAVKLHDLHTLPDNPDAVILVDHVGYKDDDYRTFVESGRPGVIICQHPAYAVQWAGPHLAYSTSDDRETRWHHPTWIDTNGHETTVTLP